MGSVSSVPSGLSLLTQPGTGILSDLPVQLSASTLQSASPQDLVDLSASALQIQEVDGLFGITPPSQPQITIPEFSTPAVSVDSASNSPVSFNLPAGVSSADLADATAGQQASIADATNQQQVLQNLFYPTLATSGTTNILA